MYKQALRDLLVTTAPAHIFTMSPSLDSLQALHTEDEQQEPNPWSDSAPTPPLVMQPLHTPSPGALDDIASPSGEMKSDQDRTHQLDSQLPADTLDTFDPLSHQEEQGARSAWANAEGHPPPPQPPIPLPKQDPLPQERASGTSESGSTSAFPSFSSFARSFALPSLPNMNMSLVAGTGTTRTRPQSLDTATLMSTPVHSAAFASQQDTETSARGSPKADHATLPPHAVQSPLRRENPSQERSAVPNKDKDPPFDFQKFLDQMKSKSAEPVARYLRSCVLLPHHKPPALSMSLLHCRFLNNFVKRTFTVADQVKLINDFLSVGIYILLETFAARLILRACSSSRRRCEKRTFGSLPRMRNSTMRWRVWKSS